ncbi:MAG: PulJ/GspJ family protein [Acidimicrobiales bacterium]
MTKQLHESGRGEGGYTLVELMVSMMVLAIVITMTWFIANQLVKISVHGTINGQAAEAAQSQIGILDQYLRGAISPTNAATEYPGISNLCSGGPGGSGTALQSANDYQLELCTAPQSPTACTSGNAASAYTACPQLYLITVDSTTCSTSYGECTVEIKDMTVSSNPVVWSLATFRCPSTCQSDLGSPKNEGNGASPSYPYLLTYYDSTGTNQVTGTNVSVVQSVHLDLEVLASPPAPVTASQIFTEISDSVWLPGAATPGT